MYAIVEWEYGSSLLTTPSQSASCCSFLRFVTRLTDPHRTKSASLSMFMKEVLHCSMLGPTKSASLGGSLRWSVSFQGSGAAVGGMYAAVVLRRDECARDVMEEVREVVRSIAAVLGAEKVELKGAEGEDVGAACAVWKSYSSPIGQCLRRLRELACHLLAHRD